MAGTRALLHLRARWFGYVVAVVAVLAISGLIHLLRAWFDFQNGASLYLLVVLVIASQYGLGPAVAASVAAFLTYDFLFVAPAYTLSLKQPDQWLGLVLLLATAVVTGRLGAAVRKRAGEARYRGLFEGVAEALLVADVQDRYVDANPAACDLLGYTREELLTLHAPDVLADGRPWEGAEPGSRARRGRWKGELE